MLLYRLTKTKKIQYFFSSNSFEIMYSKLIALQEIIKLQYFFVLVLVFDYCFTYFVLPDLYAYL